MTTDLRLIYNNLYVWAAFINVYAIYHWLPYFTNENILYSNEKAANNLLITTMLSSFLQYYVGMSRKEWWEMPNIIICVNLFSLVDYYFRMDFTCAIHCHTTQSNLFAILLIIISALTLVSFVLYTNKNTYLVWITTIIYLLFLGIFNYRTFYYFHHWQAGILCVALCRSKRVYATCFPCQNSIIFWRSFYLALFIHGAASYGTLN